MKSKQGFTLIELLVVIAIIGILSSVVLASLNTARDKGANAAAKANLNNSRAQAELYYDEQSPVSYQDVCTGTNGLSSAVDAAGEATGLTSECEDDTTAWAAQVQLKDSEGWYCVDSSGLATTTGTQSTLTDDDDTTLVCDGA